MTDKQALLIEELRKKGMGYKGIAKQIGLSRDIVRNHCVKHGLSGYATTLKKKIVPWENCRLCGADVVQPKTGRPKKFCSDRCRRLWWSIHPEETKRRAIYHLKCLHCGKDFDSYGNIKRKFCSHDCYIQYRFWREED